MLEFVIPCLLGLESLVGDEVKKLGLKENVIIGKLIPAGAGLNAYRHFAEELVPEVEPAPAAQTEETAPAAPADDAALSDED